METESTSINLQVFCGDGDFDHRIGSPFNKGAWTYATNGHIIIRVPLIAGLREDGPNAEKLFEDIARSSSGAPSIAFVTPTLPLPTRPQTEECSECEGTGYEHDCPGCDCECDECGGTGESEGLSSDKTVSVEFGGVPFACEYIRLLDTLPVLLISAPVKEKPLRFAFDGGEGVLMPLRSTRATNIIAPLS